MKIIYVRFGVKLVIVPHKGESVANVINALQDNPARYAGNNQVVAGTYRWRGVVL